MPHVRPQFSLRQFQHFIDEVYGVPDQRLYSVPDLLSNQQRFTMRALKGIRKQDKEKVRYNLLIAISWLMAVVNQLHIDLEDAVWNRFPGFCSYCGMRPCACKKMKLKKRSAQKRPQASRPKTIAEMQKMFNGIYPSTSRTIQDAGVHLAEEMGEVSEAIHIFLGEHKEKQFNEIIHEVADYISCFFGVANSTSFDVAHELSVMYRNSCHICHKAPCVCKFSFVAKLRS